MAAGRPITSTDAKEMLRLRHEEGWKIARICGHFGITSYQYYRYTQTPAARARWEQIKAAMAESIKESSQTGLGKALDTLIEACDSSDERIRVMAAGKLLDKLMPSKVDLDMTDNREVAKIQQAIQRAGEEMRK